MNLSIKKRRLGISRPNSGFQNNVITKETKSFGHPFSSKPSPISPTLRRNDEKDKDDGGALLSTTPSRRSKVLECCDDSPVNYDDSPTYAVVTWDNGYKYRNNGEDWKTRENVKRASRCKQFHRTSKSMPTENTAKTDPENFAEFVKYMEWAKSFMDKNESSMEEVASSPRCDDDGQTASFKTDSPTNFLDDSSNEAMLASSQAAEDEFWQKWKNDSSAKENELPPQIRRLVTPTAQGGIPLRKRLKMDEATGANEKNNVARILYANGSGNTEQNRATQSSSWSAKESRVATAGVTNARNLSLARSNTADNITVRNTVPPTRLSINNNNNNNSEIMSGNGKRDDGALPTNGLSSKNYAIRRFNSDNSRPDGSLIRKNSTTAKPTQLRVPPIDASGCKFARTSSRNPHSGETNKRVGCEADSFLDDGMDIFEALDYNFIDSLNNAGKVTETKNEVPIVVEPARTRYSKEEILRRRLEAQKKLASKMGRKRR